MKRHPGQLGMNIVGGGREQIHTQESEDCVSTKPRGSPLLNTAPSIGPSYPLGELEAGNSG